MSEWRLYADAPPEHTTRAWYEGRERAPHLEQQAHQGRLRLAAAFTRRAVEQYACPTCSDLGAGDGGLLSIVAGWFTDAWGYDLQPANVEGAAERGVTVHLGDVFDDSTVYGDLSICTEMLEHLADPHGFLAELPSRVLVASSPAFETADSHYEFHTWAWDRDGYRALVEQAGFGVVAHELTGGFQVLLAARGDLDA